MKHFGSLSQISVFSKIAELGSLSAAARELNLTPSAVSKSLAQLEERLGVLLVKRSTRSLTLTEHGQIILERANAIIADVENTLDIARQFGRPEGSLRVTSSIAFGCKQASVLISQYLNLYPKVDVNLALEDRRVNLAEEKYDVALRITSDTNTLYAARKLATIRWIYCASADYLGAHDPVRCPADIAGQACLVYPQMTRDNRWSFIKGDSVSQVQVKARLSSNSSLALLEAALAGQGIACLPAYLVAEHIVRQRLKIVLPAYHSDVQHTLYAMYYRSKYANPLVRSFIDFLVGEFGDSSPWERILEQAGQ
ncbi:LysR family transcriptional regulator [Pseudomonas putida]|uniref:LysR family transcriptional regulator n=1 Tax=Pseudomonas putida TaxID=303 RepID=UPI00383BC2E2